MLPVAVTLIVTSPRLAASVRYFGAWSLLPRPRKYQSAPPKATTTARIHNHLFIVAPALSWPRRGGVGAWTTLFDSVNGRCNRGSIFYSVYIRARTPRSGAVDAFQPACQDRAMPSPDAAQNGRRTLAALAVLAVVALLRWHTALFDDRLAVDESDYTGAFASVAAGGDPYAIPRFLYPPPFARAGAAAEGLLGERGVVLALRIANLAGAIAIVWISLGWSGLAWRLRLGIASLLLVAWAPVHQGIESGNVSLAVLGLTLAAVAQLPGRALAAGAMLGLGLAIKPLVPALVALLPAWRPPPPRRAGWVAAASAAVTLGVCLL